MSEAPLMNMGFNKSHGVNINEATKNKPKHNKPVYIFHGIYCKVPWVTEGAEVHCQMMGGKKQIIFFIYHTLPVATKGTFSMLLLPA